jgi:hypothetical protein
LSQLTGAVYRTAIDTVPETVEPLVGDVIVTCPVGVGVPTGVGVRVGAGVEVLLGVGDGVRFFTRTTLEALPSTTLEALKAVAVIV